MTVDLDIPLVSFRIDEPEIIQDRNYLESNRNRIINRGFRIYLCLLFLSLTAGITFTVLITIYFALPQSDPVTLWLFIANGIILAALLLIASINSIYVYIIKRDYDLSFREI